MVNQHKGKILEGFDGWKGRSTFLGFYPVDMSIMDPAQRSGSTFLKRYDVGFSSLVFVRQRFWEMAVGQKSVPKTTHWERKNKPKPVVPRGFLFVP